MKNTAKTKNPTLNVIKGDLDAVAELMVSVYNSLGEWLRNCEKLKKRHTVDWQYDRIFHGNLALEKALFQELPSAYAGIRRLDEQLKDFDPHADFKKRLLFPKRADAADSRRDPAAGGVADNQMHLVSDEHEGEAKSDDTEA